MHAVDRTHVVADAYMVWTIVPTANCTTANRVPTKMTLSANYHKQLQLHTRILATEDVLAFTMETTLPIILTVRATSSAEAVKSLTISNVPTSIDTMIRHDSVCQSKRCPSA